MSSLDKVASSSCGLVYLDSKTNFLVPIVHMAISCSVWLPSSFHRLLNHVFGQLKKLINFWRMLEPMHADI